MTVLDAAWSGSGTSARNLGAGEGACARCARSGAVVPVRAAISKTFTGFDDWDDPSGPGLCPACAWGYTAPALRSVPHLVGRDPASLQRLDRPRAGELLSSGGLSPDLALIVPLRPGRKHLLPTAVWGRISVDDARLTWRKRDAELLALVLQLRGVGFGSRMLGEPAAPFRVLRTLPPGRWSWVLWAWDELACWRAPDSPWLTLALHLTTPTVSKETVP